MSTATGSRALNKQILLAAYMGAVEVIAVSYVAELGRRLPRPIVMYRVRTIPVLGYWPILADIGWYWYWPNTFFSNCAQYWADSSLWRRLATHDDLISRNSL